MSAQEIYINIYQLPTKKTKVKTFRSQRLQGAKCRYTLRPTAGVATRVAALRDQVWKWPSATKFDVIWINQKQIRFRVPRKPTDLAFLNDVFSFTANVVWHGLGPCLAFGVD